jgi:Protein of unknown function, DUF481
LRPKAERGWLPALLWVACALTVTPAALAGPPEREKSDVVVLANGDRLTGRILYVDYGYLQLSSRHSGSVGIEWPSVRSIVSKYEFRIERFGGKTFAGPIATSADGATLLVSPGTAQEVQIPMAEISRIVPYDDDFWHRITGSASLGYDYTKSADVTQASAAMNARYNSEHVDAQLDGHVMVTHDSGGSNNQSQLISSIFFLGEQRNFWGFLGEAEGNETLGIDARLVGGPLIGRRLYESSAAGIVGLAGVVYDQEWTIDHGGAKGSTEGLFMAQWRIYKFVYPKVSLDFSAMAFPSISDAPRVRASANLALTLKVTDRFALTLTEYGNYDSKPPGGSTENLDYGVTAALTYNFGYVIP